MKNQQIIRPEKVQLTQRGEEWQAMFTFPRPAIVKGCPIGTGSSQHEAICNLVDRTNAESGTNIVIQDRE